MSYGPLDENGFGFTGKNEVDYKPVGN